MNKKYFKIISLLAILISTFTLSGCKLFEPKAKEFNIDNELKITLDETFAKSGTLNTDSQFTTGVQLKNETQTVLVQIFRWKQSQFSSFEKPNLTEFSKIITSENLSYDAENELCYTGEYISNRVFIRSYFYQTDFAYYEVDFRYVKSNDNRIHNWAKSINFTQDLIYDVDQSMTNEKTIILNQQDEATIKIGTSFIKVLGQNTYQKIHFSGSSYNTILNITIDNKSSYDSLEEYADSTEYNNRNVSNKNYIALSGSGYFSGYQSATIYAYCFESSNHYYTVEFMSSDPNMLQRLDSYADSFQAN